MSVLLQEHVYRLDWPVDRAPPLAVACIRFQPETIDADSFRSAGIDLPPHIAAAVPKRQREFFYGRLCAQAAMAPLRPHIPQIGTGRMREPLWPVDLIGSITHAADMAAAVVLPVSTGYHGVGIDIEHLLGGPGAQEVRAIVANDAELRYLAGFGDALGPDLPLTLIFSAKESFFKAVHGEVRRYFDFDAIELEHIDLSARRMRFRVCEDLTPDLRRGVRCGIHFRMLDATHVATLCLWRRGAGAV
ncbi:4'-phosphopantetheinyl transferase EntD (siderophore biosynthesis) [Duganella sp. CF517]|uniref:4'-phosphopantetheinyl transferase family protein n=1 Tax=Duganella sp. CF517 TaxID=1881038 RepID=UPI0008CC653F|nr:4'-phosphopantetheinyl transferase superfamily protein [Duganella sp. CF517]SEN06988.1 4'-phosphopantetheinyl transferase EntD (siderophore biosynthesis) [Duganella sp. CF517]